MKRVYKLKRYSNYAGLFLILGVFVSLFYCLNYIYTLNSKNNKTILLDKSLFNSNSLLNKETNNFKVNNVSKLDLDYSMYNIKILEDDSFAFETTDAENNDRICTLDITQDTSDSDQLTIDNSDKNQNKLKANNLKELYKANDGYIGNYDVSEDGKKIIFFGDDYSKQVDGKKYLYDVEAKKTTQISEKSYCNIITGNNKYIGVNDEYLFMKDLDTGKTDNLASMKGILSSNNVTSKNVEKYNLSLSTNEKYVYLVSTGSQNGNGFLSYIYQINLKNKEASKTSIPGYRIKLVPLLDGNFIFSGQIEGENGIFIYNMQTKNYKNLRQGNISDVAITKDNKRISYIDTNNDGSSKIHVGSFNKDKIESDTVIYNDPRYGLHAIWSNDGNKLYYFTFYNEGTGIYRFSFNS